MKTEIGYDLIYLDGASNNIDWQQGDIKAQSMLGHILSGVLGSKNEDLLNFVEAYKWYRLAAEKGGINEKDNLENLKFMIRTPPPRRHGNQKIREQVKSLKLYMKRRLRRLNYLIHGLHIIIFVMFFYLGVGF